MSMQCDTIYAQLEELKLKGGGAIINKVVDDQAYNYYTIGVKKVPTPFSP